jgi:hypothetical protein
MQSELLVNLTLVVEVVVEEQMKMQVVELAELVVEVEEHLIQEHLM